MKATENIKKWLIRVFGQFGIMALVVAASSGTTYYLCQTANESHIAELQDSISDLKQIAFKAGVTQRVSEQMEDIAFEQKKISDQQKEEAVKQSHIADLERTRAEFEKGMARQAEVKAVRSARQADSMRVVAENQTTLATNNMLAAEEAKAKADTLYYRSLANSLAQSSLGMGNTATDLSRLLAYAAWTYNNEYGGPNQINIYRALLNSSESIHKIKSSLEGNVRTVNILQLDNVRWAFALTDYGEAYYCNEYGEQRQFQMGDYPFRDMVRIEGNKFVALSSDGRVVVFKADGYAPVILKETQVGAGVWQHIRRMKDGTLVLQSDKSVVWLNGNTLVQKAARHFNIELTALGYEFINNIIHVFGQNDRHFTSTQAGELREAKLADLDGDVTAYSYDAKNKWHLLGSDVGKIYVVGLDGQLINTLNGHSGRISSVRIQTNSIVSTSYDNTIRFWAPDNRNTFAVSMEYNLGEWPLTFVVDEKTMNVWLGCGNGHLQRYCMSAKKNANSTQALLNREFTDNEWNYFFGSNVPRRNFMKGGEK